MIPITLVCVRDTVTALSLPGTRVGGQRRHRQRIAAWIVTEMVRVSEEPCYTASDLPFAHLSLGQNSLVCDQTIDGGNPNNSSNVPRTIEL